MELVAEEMDPRNPLQTATKEAACMMALGPKL
jgi:hypothetical protein